MLILCPLNGDPVLGAGSPPMINDGKSNMSQYPLPAQSLCLCYLKMSFCPIHLLKNSVCPLSPSLKSSTNILPHCLPQSLKFHNQRLIPLGQWFLSVVCRPLVLPKTFSGVHEVKTFYKLYITYIYINKLYTTYITYKMLHAY